MKNGTGNFSQRLSDEYLANRFKKTGDVNIVGEFYKRYIHLVYGVCLKYLKNREDGMDAAMQVFESLFIKLKKQDIKLFRNWLYVITKNHCLMILRSKAHESKWDDAYQLSEEFVESGNDLHPLEKDTLNADNEALNKCIEKLSKNQKECIKLFYIKKKCYKEIAILKEYKIKKVKSYIQNGKRNLKICIEKVNAKAQ